MKVTNFLIPFTLILIQAFFAPLRANEADSLRKLIRHAVADTQQIRLINQLADYYLKVQLDSARHYNAQALEAYKGDKNTQLYRNLSNTRGSILYEKGDYTAALSAFMQLLMLQSAANDTKGLLSTYNKIGTAYFYLDNLDSSLTYFTNSLHVHKYSGNLKGQSEALNNIGVVFMYQGNYPDAITNLLESAKIDESLGDEINASKAYNNIGMLYDDQKEYGRAATYYKKALEIRRRHDYRKGIYSSLNNLGVTYKNQKKYDEALVCLYEAVELGIELGYNTGLALTYSNIGIVLAQQEKYKEALTFHLKAQAIDRTLADSLRIAANYINLADTYRSLGDYSNAYKNIRSGMDIIQQSRYAKNLADAYQVLVEIHAGSGQYEQALTAYRTLSALRDSLFNVEKTEKIEDIRTRYETEKKEKEILLLREQTALQQKEQALADLKLANRKRWIYGLGLGMLALFFLGGFVLQRNKRIARARRDKAIIRERELGIRAVIDGQEKERQRIAKDLHDGIGQQLSALKMGWQVLLEKLNTNNLPEAGTLITLTRTLDETAGEVRSLSHQMMPRVLHEMGLVPALEDMLEKSLGKGKVKYAFEHFGLEERCSANVEISLYRIAQELVNNIIKHSGATEVSLQLFRNSNKLVMIAEDNGIGFDIAAKSEGIGLMNIKSRLNTIDGEVNYEPSPGSGTVATIRIPLS